jgi:hypothetical protein
MFTLKLQPSVCKLEAVVFFYPIDNLPILWYIGYVMYISLSRWFKKYIGVIVVIFIFALLIFITTPTRSGDSNSHPCGVGSTWDAESETCIYDSYHDIK